MTAPAFRSKGEADDHSRGATFRAIQSTAEKLDEIDEMMARREQQHADDLMLQVRKTRYQEVLDGARRAGAPRTVCHALRQYGEETRFDDRQSPQPAPCRSRSAQKNRVLNVSKRTDNVATVTERDGKLLESER